MSKYCHNQEKNEINMIQTKNIEKPFWGAKPRAL